MGWDDEDPAANFNQYLAEPAMTWLADKFKMNQWASLKGMMKNSTFNTATFNTKRAVSSSTSRSSNRGNTPNQSYRRFIQFNQSRGGTSSAQRNVTEQTKPQLKPLSTTLPTSQNQNKNASPCLPNCKDLDLSLGDRVFTFRCPKSFRVDHVMRDCERIRGMKRDLIRCEDYYKQLQGKLNQIYVIESKIDSEDLVFAN